MENPKKKYKIKIDPAEVLGHLQKLGYHDISPEHLKEFMKDLKKLIKYDLRKKEQKYSKGSSYDAVDNILQSRSPLSNTSEYYSSTSSDSESLCTTESTRGSTPSTSDIESDAQSTSSSSSYEQVNEPPKKPSKSFIRPRNIGVKDGPRRRCDPVALYQYYDQFWKQFKVPGEDPRNELRWSIRERMLGSQPTSTEYNNTRRPKNKFVLN